MPVQRLVPKATLRLYQKRYSVMYRKQVMPDRLLLLNVSFRPEICTAFLRLPPTDKRRGLLSDSVDFQNNMSQLTCDVWGVIFVGQFT